MATFCSVLRCIVQLVPSCIRKGPKCRQRMQNGKNVTEGQDFQSTMTLRAGRSLWCPKALSKQAVLGLVGADKVTALTRFFCPLAFKSYIYIVVELKNRLKPLLAGCRIVFYRSWHGEQSSFSEMFKRRATDVTFTRSPSSC